MRRKKCDEGKPACKACRHLNLKCEYKRPVWWSNNELRRQQKEHIKNIIRHTKLAEKASHAQAHHTVPFSANTPPSLCHSLPTSDGSDVLSRTRAASIESQFSLDFNDYHRMPHMNQLEPAAIAPEQFTTPLVYPYPECLPYEADVKTDCQTMVNGVTTRRDSTISNLSAFQQPLDVGTAQPLVDNWTQIDYFEDSHHSVVEEPFSSDYFDFPYGSLTPSRQSFIQVDDCDRHLLNHFLDNVLRLIFPILDANRYGSARSDVVLPALESNKCYLHCCLSIAAQHLKATESIPAENIDHSIMTHRFATVSELCTALNEDADYQRILEATLGMIFFQCSVGSADDSLPDIPWHQHFEAATKLLHRLEMPRVLLEANSLQSPPPFDMTLAAWIDILGATHRGRAPVFADTYREKHLAVSTIGLAELMGCEDRIMFLISEIACLEGLKLDGMEDVVLCQHIKLLGDQISLCDASSGSVASAYDATTGELMPKQLSTNITAVFRLAARIYLCSLVPDFDRQQPSITNLVAQLTETMEMIPAGQDGFDRSVVWPLLVAGAVSVPGSSFRTMLDDRAALLGGAAGFGSFGRARELLKDVWRINDEGALAGQRNHVRWADVMRQKGWDFLLI